MKQNLDIFDFKLTGEEMEQLKAWYENKSMWAAYGDDRKVRHGGIGTAGGD